MNALALNTVDVSSYDVFANNADLHHDLLTFIDYVSTRSIKRTARTNELQKSDLKELTKRFSLSASRNAVDQEEANEWIGFVDYIAWVMSLVSYSGNASYSDSSLDSSISDNYVVVNEKQAKVFLELSPVEQERAIRAELLKMSLKYINEMFDNPPTSRLDGFNNWQRTSTTLTQADFFGARTRLLSILATLKSGVWYSVADLVKYMKENHPFFLLPKNVVAVRRMAKPGRYSGLTESRISGMWGSEEILEDAPDAFERVEGRFIERFFEHLPLLMRYVEVAYSTEPHRGSFPERGKLRAFRVNDRFLHLMQSKTPPPQVTVQPNFEVIVVSEIFPADIFAQIGPLCDLLSESVGQSGPSVYTLRLKQERVAEAVAANPQLDPVPLLARYSNQELAQNVVMELREWAALSEVFTLYEGFGLLEAAGELPAEVKINQQVQVADGVLLVRHADEVFKTLEEQGLVPVRVDHPPDGLILLSEPARTRFSASIRSEVTPADVQPVSIRRFEKVVLVFNGQKEAFAALRKALLAEQVPLESDEKTMQLIFPKEYDAAFQKALQSVSDRFDVRVT